MNTSENSTLKTRPGKRFLILLGILAFAASAALVYGFFIEPDRLVVNKHEINIPNWDKRLDGIRIAALSDVHGGANFIDEAKLRLVVETVNAQKPDVIVLLGDYVSQIGSKGPMSGRKLKMPMSVIAKALGGLKAPHGVIAVTGNHDDWYDRSAVRSELEKNGIKVLVDEVATIEKDGAKIHFAGLRDLMSLGTPRQFHDDAKTLASTVPDGELVVLDHNPDIVPYIVGEYKISDNLRLVLGAHTHGGQVWFPVVGSLIVPSEYSQRFASGHSVESDIDVFVTTGIGTSIMPVRFLVPPEIAILTIRGKG